MSRPKTDMPWFKACAHPGCTSRMHKNTTTYDAGFCARHGGRHLGKAGAMPKAEPVVEANRPGIRVAEVTVAASSGSSSTNWTARVSLPKEPWA